MTNPRLEELRAKFHENPRRYFAPYANELRKAGDPAQAIAVCRTHLAGQPGHVSGHIVLGQALYEAGESTEARDIFTAALELDPENLIALRSLGEIAQVNGDFSAARQWYQRLLDADPRNTEVSQLLRDIPADAPAKPVVAPEPESREAPTPFTIREEIAAAESTPTAEAAPAESGPRIHTGFTGSGPAYKTEEDLLEEARASETARPETEDAFIDLQPSAHDSGTAAPEPVTEFVDASTESEPMELVDIGEETEVVASEAIQEAMPDDSFEFAEALASEDVPESGIEPELRHDEESVPEPISPEMAVEPDSGFETVETYTTELAGGSVQSLEIEDFAADALTPSSSSESAPPDEPSEPPRAMFAERGFDGSVDEMGWMTTPSQAFSDLEAAPEDWLEETRDESPVSETAGEAPTAGAGVAEDHAHDSWFDDVPGASSIEATEVTSDELWLPPELPQVTNAEANVSSHQEIEMVAEATTEASSVEDDIIGVAPNAAESEWSPATDVPAVPAGAEASEYSHDDTADEVGEPVDAESVQESLAASMLGSTGPDEGAGHADVTHAAAIESEPASQELPSEYDDEHLSEVPPEFVYASSSQTTSSSGSGIGQTPSDALQSQTSSPAPFLTETLAELYLQQGFRDEALSIYRQLLDRNPGDAALKSRIAALEHVEVSSPAPGPAESRAGSQSVRTFFSRLARREAVVPPRAAVPPSSSGQGGEPQSDVPFSVAASALANLFSASKPSQSDEGAASTLAGAFTDPAGRPSRAAERELSLDHLFRDVAPGGPATGQVTLDQFYSAPNSGTGSSTESGSEPGGEDPSGTDIRQFTAWLEGLRKK